MKLSTEDRITVTAYIDPVCPYAWVTSQWLRDVARARPLDLDFRTMSLAILNQDPADPLELTRGYESAWRPVRVAEAIAATRGPEHRHRYFYEFGHRYHDLRERPRDTVLRDTLAALDAMTLYGAADDQVWDEAVIASHHAALDGVGDDVGTPIVRIGGTGIFGPVLTTVPDTARGAAIFDAVATLIAHPEFTELKRTRTTSSDE
ncbi:disulfide bond formation protein DsbA [Pseudonocardia sp. ICBG601]|uniref:mycothiol-dependent nitroreductase Rv2466c family protein n=1 Tax=Pseudonocardia sp. ICBG601 TaxID=2846759 RepID=UPI001CF6E027|nr:disulfide bond formation protein DsbA [Pseudonocardia sp. ICBG601]